MNFEVYLFPIRVERAVGRGVGGRHSTATGRRHAAHPRRTLRGQVGLLPDIGDLVLLVESLAALPDAAKVEAAANIWPALVRED